MKKILVSACLLGCECRYDGASKPCEKVLALADNEKAVLIPVCPEQLGGLPTPRVPSERQRDSEGRILPVTEEKSVIMKDGTDVSENYAKGAETALSIARLNKVDLAVLKSGSPSCGKALIYDGSFTGTKAPGNGVTVDLLESNGIKVLSEEDL